MTVLDPGHKYALEVLDGNGDHHLMFVKREGPGYPGNVGHHSGVNIQEVCRALIDRVKYLDNQISCRENTEVLRCLRDAIWWLELRAAGRHKRVEEFVKIAGFGANIEDLPTCEHCGHIGCENNCKNLLDNKTDSV